MRIYAKFEDVGTEYYTTAPIKVSLSPIEGDDVRYLDLEEGKEYNSVEYEGEDPLDTWKVWNGTQISTEFYIIEESKVKHMDKPFKNLGKYDSPVVEEGKAGYTLEDGRYIPYESEDTLQCRKYQKYKNGEPTGEPYYLCE